MHINCPHHSAGLHRSSSSPVSQGHSRMLPAARNQRTPVPHGAQAPVEGLEDQGTGQSRDLHAVVLRQIPLPQGSHSEPGLLSAAEGFEDFGTHTGQPAARKSYVCYICSYVHTELHVWTNMQRCSCRDNYVTQCQMGSGQKALLISKLLAQCA